MPAAEQIEAQLQPLMLDAVWKKHIYDKLIAKAEREKTIEQWVNYWVIVKFQFLTQIYLQAESFDYMELAYEQDEDLIDRCESYMNDTVEPACIKCILTNATDQERLDFQACYTQLKARVDQSDFIEDVNCLQND